jgi:hypothetical protein
MMVNARARAMQKSNLFNEIRFGARQTCKTRRKTGASRRPPPRQGVSSRAAGTTHRTTSARQKTPERVDQAPIEITFSPYISKH